MSKSIIEGRNWIMKKKILYGVIIAIIIVGISCIYLYEKYTVHFSAISLEDLDLEPFDFLPSRQESEHTSANVLEK